MVVIAVAWRRVYASEGSLNSLLSAIGLDSLTRGWLGDYDWALPAVGFIGTWFEIGLVTVLMMAGMSRIPTQQYEAARLDGAGPVREFFAVTLPAVRGQISVALTLTVIASLKTFDLIYMTTKGGPGYQTTVPSYEVYRQAFEQGKVGLASAIGVPASSALSKSNRPLPRNRFEVGQCEATVPVCAMRLRSSSSR